MLCVSDQKLASNSVNQQEILLQSPHSLFPHVSLKPPLIHPVPPSHVHCEPMLIQHSVLTPLLTASSSVLNANNNNNRVESLLLNREVPNQNLLNTNRDAILLSRNETAILLNSDSQILNSDRLLNGDGQISNKNQMLATPGSLMSPGVGVLNSNIGNSILLNQNNNSPLLHSPTSGNLLNQSSSSSSTLTTSNTVRSSGSLPPSTG